MPPVGDNGRAREEDVRNVKASRSRNLLKAGQRCQGRSGPSGGVAPVLCLSDSCRGSPVVHVDDDAEREEYGDRHTGTESWRDSGNR